MVRVNYRVPTMKSSVDIAIALRCGEWSSGIDPRHRRRIIAAAIAIGVGCEKREVLGLSFLRRMRKEDRRNGTQGTMESIEIKSKKEIRRKRYQKH